MSAGLKCAAAVLAGGRSVRMGDVHKALAPLPGGCMVEHVLRRLAPQASRLCLCVAPGDRAAFTNVADDASATIVTDDRPAHRGPLSGLAAGLAWLAAFEEPDRPDWLLLVPCDAPFLPPDLATRLLAAAGAGDSGLVMARYQGRRQPTFSLWHTDVAPSVTAALAEPESGGLIHLAERTAHVVVDWPRGEPPPFFNVNTPADLAAARRRLDPGAGES